MSRCDSDIAVELRDVSVRLGSHLALDSVNLTVPVHDFLAVIGPNGGGKTTLLRVMLGIVRPDRGTVRVFGCPPEQVRGRVAYVPQFALFDLDFPIRVRDVVQMGQLRPERLLYPWVARDRRPAMAALERVGLAELAPRLVGGLSGGHEILVLDEPTASLDVQSADSFYKLLADLAEQMTVVITSHDIGSVSTHVKDMACINSRLYSHALGELTPARVAEIYGCPIELIAHGVPHRVLSPHDAPPGAHQHDAGHGAHQHDAGHGADQHDAGHEAHGHQAAPEPHGPHDHAGGRD
jgi:zinc transport system ATP-binding protein